MTFLNIFIGVFTFVLVLISLFLVFIVLMQKSKDGGMGAAMGGGVVEATFGADSGNILVKTTRNAAIAFFIVSLALYCAQLYRHKAATTPTDALPSFAPASAPAAAAPAAPAQPAPAPAAK